jgi:hypothetical protein
MQAPVNACVHGHFPFGMHWMKPWRPSTYISFLRDPVSRVVSHYYFVRQSPWHPMYDRHMNIPLEHIFEDEQNLPVSALRSNLQTRFLAGYRHRFWSQTSDLELLRIAKRNVEKHYTFIGLQERYEESCTRMEDQFGWTRKEEVPREQKTKEKPELSERIRGLILD